MRRLVALDILPGPSFVAALQRCFDAKDAVLPVDQRLPQPARARLFQSLLPSAVIDSSGEETPLEDGQAVEEGDAIVIATSGTTGEPRGVVLTHDAIAASARATSSRLSVDPLHDRWLCCLPVAHIGGLSVILRSILTGTPCEVLSKFDAFEVARAANERGASLVSLVPTALGRLGTQAGVFRKILLGGSAIPSERPDNTVATYGMTETGSGVVYEGVPLDGVEMRVDATGEIALRAPMLLRCYRDGSDPKDAAGWFATGDAGSIGNDGMLSVFGRIAEVIVTGGEKVWPSAVENVLASHRSVAEVAVVGQSDVEWGARVVAFCVPVHREAPPSLDELRELVKDTIGPFAAPRQIVVVDELPKTALGKVRRTALVAPPMGVHA